eukprot:584770-Prorocentrum_minimum.AAC.1
MVSAGVTKSELPAGSTALADCRAYCFVGEAKSVTQRWRTDSTPAVSPVPSTMSPFQSTVPPLPSTVPPLPST